MKALIPFVAIFEKKSLLYWENYSDFSQIIRYKPQVLQNQ